MKKGIVFVLMIITAMVLSMGLLTCNAAPEATPAQEGQATPAQEEQAPPIIETKINFDGSVVASFTSVLTKEALASNPNILELVKPQLKDTGYEAELIDVDGGKALKYSIKIKPGEKFVYGPPAVGGSQGFQAFSTKGFFGTTYAATSQTFDLSKYPATGSLAKIIFDAPVNATYSNATSKENGGRVSVWDLKNGGTYSVEYLVTVPNILNIAVLLLIIILIIFVIFMIILSNKKKAQKALADLSEEDYSVDSENFVSVDSEEDPFVGMSQEEIDSDIEETDNKDK